MGGGERQKVYGHKVRFLEDAQRDNNISILGVKECECKIYGHMENS
jgi:hypothetical protein